MYVTDGDYIKDIEINDLRNRYTLTKGSTQKLVITTPVLLLISRHSPNSSLSYLLLLVSNYCGCVEAYPIHHSISPNLFCIC